MDAQEVVDRIRSFLESDDWRFDEQLRELAENYAKLCRETNQRLRQCERLLQQQLKSEAIQLAEVEPKVLDLVAVLDFPERAEWEEVVVTYDLPQAERLLTSVADELNRAYNDQLPLERLLEKHRLLALARAPLPWRLAVLRRLAKADPESLFWEDDIRDMERARLDEMREQLRRAVEQVDAQTAEQIVSELKKGEWLVPEAKELRSIAERELQKVRRMAARRELETVAQELNDAFAALDLPTARRLQERWNELAAVAELTPDDELAELAAPALGWVSDQLQIEEQEKQYEQLISKIESLLDEDAPNLEQLERLASGVEKLGRALPPPLARRYENRLRAGRLARRRRQILLVGGAVLAVVLLAAVVTVVVRQRIYAKRLAEAVQYVQEMIDQDKLEQARQFIDANSQFTSSPQWQKVVGQLQEAEQKEKDRQQQLQSLVARLQQAEDFSQAKKLLEQARDVAKTTKEKLMLAELEQDWVRKEAEARAQKVREFEHTIEQATQLFKQLEQASAEDETRLARLLADAETAVMRLEQAAPELGAAAVSQASAMRARLTDATKQVEQRRRERELLRTLGAGMPAAASAPTASSILNHHVATLERFVSELPDSPRTVDFKRALSYENAWRAAIKWAQLCAEWSSLVPDSTSGQEAAARASACRNLLATHPDAPDADLINKCEKIFTAIARRGGAGDSEINLRQSWLELLTDPVLSNAYYLQTLDGKSWYLPEPAGFGGRPAAILSYYVDYGRRTDKKSFRKDDLLELEARQAPHVTLLRPFVDRMTHMSLAAWDKWHLELAVKLLEADEVDPLLRYVLLMQVLKKGGEGNPFLQAELAELQSRLKNDQIDLGARWMDPQDRDAEMMRQLAERLLQGVKADELKRYWEQAEKAMKAFQAELHRPLLLAGAVLREANGGWYLKSAQSARQAGALLLVASAAQSRTVWKQAGTLDGQKVTWSQDAQKLLCEGTLVFLRPGLGQPATTDKQSIHHSGEVVSER